MRNMWKDVLEDEQKHRKYSNTSALLSLYYLLASVKLSETMGNFNVTRYIDYWKPFRELLLSLTDELKDVAVSNSIPLEQIEEDTIDNIQRDMRKTDLFITDIAILLLQS